MNPLHRIMMPILCLAVMASTPGCAARGAAPSTGKAGSMARFAIKGNYLFTLSPRRLRVFSLESGHSPRQVTQFRVPTWMAETLFLSKDRLFVGSRNGMYIYNVKNPARPVLVGKVRHFNSCDPVVVKGNYAYVTLRSGSRCRRGKNVLQVYDVTRTKRPRLVATYPMTNPWGLGVDGNLLFVADGMAGLRVFDIRNPRKPVHLSTHPTIHGYDVIPDKQVLIVSAEDGLYQLDYGTSSLQYLSRIPIGNPKAPPIRINAPLMMIIKPPPPPPPPRKKIPRP